MGIITTLLVDLLKGITEYIAINKGKSNYSREELDLYVSSQTLAILALTKKKRSEEDLKKTLTASKYFAKRDGWNFVERRSHSYALNTKLIKIELEEYRKWDVLLGSIGDLIKEDETLNGRNNMGYKLKDNLQFSEATRAIAFGAFHEKRLKCTPAEVGKALKAYQLFNDSQLPIDGNVKQSIYKYMEIYNVDKVHFNKVKGGYYEKDKSGNPITSLNHFDVEFIKTHKPNIQTVSSKEKMAKFIQDNES